ncbi:redoxin domain-containing protein [Francisella sp. 19X1-34]|uniref:redoxin domain-containing protein n=1 Tax=Francisella sp. 19X1-34 TaxID=3087177 RepID=UPI002E3738A0|nr:redoxin domain-containing protein [Francisella sp. 19X1-34]MED7788047.1 redoxin family protein [Francisella sp. 19X1-34]
MYTTKLHAGTKFPNIIVKNLNNSSVILGKPAVNTEWQVIIVYRGRHCPLCTKYLNQIETYRKRLLENKVDLVAVSADSKEQLEDHLKNLNIGFPIYYGLTQVQMESLGLYISEPRSAQETDHNFAEPGLFVVNEKNLLHVVDVSNNPFVRPELEALVSGLEWIRDPKNNYPIRGTVSY